MTAYSTLKPEQFTRYWKDNNLSCVIYTGRGRGKSVLLTTLLMKTRGIYDAIFIFSSTFSDNSQLYGIFNTDEDEGFKLFDINKVDLMSTLEALYKHIKEVNIGDDKKNHLKVLIAFDDIFTSSGYSQMMKKNNNTLLDIFNNGRHKSISVIILAQDLKYILRPMRKNTDLFITFEPSTRDEVEELSATLNPFKSRREFEDVIYSLEEYQPLLLFKRNGFKYIDGNVCINFDKVINTKKLQ